MCTVSFVHTKNTFIITSNRDEKIIRPKAIVPKTYIINSKKIFFPKDPKAGGTWYAVNENGEVMVLLNGAAEKHIPKEKYARSRGQIVLEIISAENCLNQWQTIDLNNVEPFTLVFFSKTKLYQLRWNELDKETKQLDTDQNHIWSSSTLYPKEIRTLREKWFDQFLSTTPLVSAKKMIAFHRNTENTDSENGLVINREAKMITQSITQTEINTNKISFCHLDLIDNTDYHNTFLLL
jgi:uncharacterized protein with NRDE domain